METMTQEDKELLLKDLCGRVPYRVKCKYDDRLIVNTLSVDFFWEKIEGYERYVNCTRKYDVENIKPYLFPLSSMTEEQRQEYTYIVNYISPDDTDNWKEGEFIYVEQFTQLMHFYHINHLDYMGLIPKGLAIDATNLNVY